MGKMRTVSVKILRQGPDGEITSLGELKFQGEDDGGELPISIFEHELLPMLDKSKDGE